MEITLGCTVAKPVVTQEQCDAYAAMAQSVNAHNAACAVGDMLWEITDNGECYTVAEGGTVPEPEEEPDPEPTMDERMKSLEEQNEMLKQCLLEMSETVYA